MHLLSDTIGDAGSVQTCVCRNTRLKHSIWPTLTVALILGAHFFLKLSAKTLPQ